MTAKILSPRRRLILDAAVLGDLALTCGMPLAGSSAVMSSTRMLLISERRHPVSIASLSISLQALDPSSSTCSSRNTRMSSGISGVALE